MRTKTLAALMLVGLAACGSTPSTQTPRALTERDFAADPTLLLEPGMVAAMSLEAKDATSSSLPDTGALGVDEIPFVIHDTTTYTLGLDPADTTGTMEKVELKDASGKLLSTLTPSSRSATLVLTPGTYKHVLYSGYTKAQEPSGARTVFLHPKPTSIVAPGVAGSAGPSPQYNQELVFELLDLNSCHGCDLSGADLSTYYLSGANLFNANLFEAKTRQRGVAPSA